MCEVPSKFTVDYEALLEIYKDPAKFILDYVVKFDERYSINKEETGGDNIEVPEVPNKQFDHVDLTKYSKLYEIPLGFTVVQYTAPDGTTEDIIAYCTENRDVTDEDIKQLDLALGNGNYRLLSSKVAKAYIKAKDKALNAAEKVANLKKEELEKPDPSERRPSPNPFNMLFGMFNNNDK